MDEDPSDDDEEHLTGAGKAMKKLVRKVEKNTAYDSDNEKNPYASSVSGATERVYVSF